MAKWMQVVTGQYVNMDLVTTIYLAKPIARKSNIFNIYVKPFGEDSLVLRSFEDEKEAKMFLEELINEKNGIKNDNIKLEAD